MLLFLLLLLELLLLLLLLIVASERGRRLMVVGTGVPGPWRLPERRRARASVAGPSAWKNGCRLAAYVAVHRATPRPACNAKASMSMN